jgi:hypothetical protein
MIKRRLYNTNTSLVPIRSPGSQWSLTWDWEAISIIDNSDRAADSCCFWSAYSNIHQRSSAKPPAILRQQQQHACGWNSSFSLRTCIAGISLRPYLDHPQKLEFFHSLYHINLWTHACNIKCR